MPSSLLTPDDYFPLVEARHCDPFRVLGIRSVDGGFLARVLRPDAAEATVILDSKEAKSQKLVRVDEHGLFEGEIKGFSEGMSYTLHLTGHDGRQWRERDAYSFGPVLGEMDIYLFNEGTHYDVHKVLGAHVKLIDELLGISFFIPSAPFPPKARGRRGFVAGVDPVAEFVEGMGNCGAPGIDGMIVEDCATSTGLRMPPSTTAVCATAAKPMAAAHGHPGPIEVIPRPQ